MKWMSHTSNFVYVQSICCMWIFEEGLCLFNSFFIDTLMFFLILPVNIFLDAIASPMSGSKLTFVNKVLKGHQGTRSYI